MKKEAAASRAVAVGIAACIQGRHCLHGSLALCLPGDWEESAHSSAGSGSSESQLFRQVQPCLHVQASGLCLVLLSRRQDAFHGLSDGAKRLQAELQGEGTLQVQLLPCLLLSRSAYWKAPLRYSSTFLDIPCCLSLSYTGDREVPGLVAGG